MLHFILDANTRPDVPVWFREGLVAWLAGDGAISEQMQALTARHSRTEMIRWLRTGLPPRL
jgi:hypothetical protein